MSKPKFAGFEKSQYRRQRKKLQIPPHNTGGIKRHRKFRGMRPTYRRPQLLALLNRLCRLAKREFNRAGNAAQRRSWTLPSRQLYKMQICSKSSGYDNIPGSISISSSFTSTPAYCPSASMFTITRSFPLYRTNVPMTPANGP